MIRHVLHITILMFALAGAVLGQNTNITASYDDTPFREIVKDLEARYDVRFYFD